MKTERIIKTSIIATSIILSPMALAMPTLNYGPFSASAVPTLSGTMLIILSLLLMTVAFRLKKKNRQATSKFFISLIGVAALISGTNGIKLVSDATAFAPTPDIVLSNQSGGSVHFVNNQINQFKNTTANPLKIISINYDTCRFPKVSLSGLSECKTGNTLNGGQKCEIDCRNQCEINSDCLGGASCTYLGGDDGYRRCVGGGET